MISKLVREKLAKLEKRLFFSQIVLLDTANIILQYGINGYLEMVNQITNHKPEKIIGKMDASAKYKIKRYFGKKAFKNINELIERGEIECTPSKSECDVYLIQANINIPDSILVSNDCYCDFNPFWVSALRIVKFIKIDSKFYFNLDLKGVVDISDKELTNSYDSKESELKWFERLTNSDGEFELYPKSEVEQS